MGRVETIRQYVIEEFLPGVPADELDPDYDLLGSGVIDSLGLLKVIAWLEHRFDVNGEDVDLTPENFRSVAAIDAWIDEATARVGTGRP